MTQEPDPKLYLSPPDVTELEIDFVVAALRSGWVAPIGPDIDAFESVIAECAGVSHAVALASGTAALHLGLKGLGVEPGDDVIVPTLTFGATAFAVMHAGARPIFVDCEASTWNLDAELLGDTLRKKSTNGCLPKAIVTVDIFGRTCDYDPILEIADLRGVPVLEDAAEALCSTYKDRNAGSLGDAGVFSFNGNKIMTTSGGGMFVTDDEGLAQKVRFWSTQSRQPFPWYEHEELGYNFRMSNILAALGRGQIQRLPTMIARRRSILAQYSARFADNQAIQVLGDPPWGTSNAWLTTVRFDLVEHADAPTRVREALAAKNVEARPVWKPMHQQPLFKDAESHLTGVADAVFDSGLCLPSGSAMTEADVDRVADIILATLKE